MHKSHRCWCRVLSSSPHLCPQVSIALISFLETMLLIYLSYKVRSPAPCPRGKQRSVPIATLSPCTGYCCPRFHHPPLIEVLGKE